MPDGLAVALATPGLVWLALAIGIAGVVRGFTGFGTALIFVPVAGQFLSATEVVLVMTVTGVASSAALLPRAWSFAERRDVAILAFAALCTIPIGVFLLTRLDDMTIRWIVASVATVTLLALVTGWRYRSRVKTSGLGAIGAAAGVIGGMTGLTGPVVILFYLAGQARAQIVRANTIIFLAVLDLGIVITLFAKELIDTTSLWLGFVLAVPYFCTSMIGQALFRPDHDRLYRGVAYGVIALAVLTGMPLFD